MFLYNLTNKVWSVFFLHSHFPSSVDTCFYITIIMAFMVFLVDLCQSAESGIYIIKYGLSLNMNLWKLYTLLVLLLQDIVTNMKWIKSRDIYCIYWCVYMYSE